MLHTYHPEMNQQPNSNATIRANLSHYGRHYFVSSKNPIAIKQGVEFLKTLESSELNELGQYRVGWHEYKMTIKAFDKLCKMEDVNLEMLLD